MPRRLSTALLTVALCAGVQSASAQRKRAPLGGAAVSPSTLRPGGGGPSAPDLRDAPRLGESRSGGSIRIPIRVDDGPGAAPVRGAPSPAEARGAPSVSTSSSPASSPARVMVAPPRRSVTPARAKLPAIAAMAGAARAARDAAQVDADAAGRASAQALARRQRAVERLERLATSIERLDESDRALSGALDRLERDAATAARERRAASARLASSAARRDGDRPGGSLWSTVFTDYLSAYGRFLQVGAELPGASSNDRQRARLSDAEVLYERALVARDGNRELAADLRGQVPAARTEAGSAEAELAVAKRTFGRAMFALGRARTTAEQVDGELAAAEALARAADLRYRERLASADQHRLEILTSRAGRSAYRAAVRRFRAFGANVSKPGELTQDAYALGLEQGRAAISDGVTQSDFSGELAQALVSAWAKAPPARAEGFAEWVTGVQARWAAATGDAIARAQADGFGLRREFRADATFVGTTLRREGGKVFLDTLAIGDSALFIVRGGKLVRAFPLEKSSAFSNVVETVSSQGAPRFKPRLMRQRVQPGDEILLTTDALAKWILGEVEAGRPPFALLRRVQDPAALGALVEAGRGGDVPSRGTLDVDDTTLVRFVIPKS